MMPMVKAPEACKMVLLGLDRAGKTTFLYQLKLGEILTTIPTIGVNLETVERGSLKLEVFDVGGRDKIRALWRHYFSVVDVLLFMVDASDRECIVEAAEELEKLSGEDKTAHAVFCILANKNDLPNIMSLEEIASKLKLNKLAARHVGLFSVSAATDAASLAAPLDWIASVWKSAVSSRLGVPPLIAESEPGFTRDLANIAPQASGMAVSVDASVLGPDSGEEFLACFAARDAALFSRRAFTMVRLRLMHAQLVALGRRKAVKWLHSELAKLPAETGRGNVVYHCTIVYFWLQMVDYFLAVDKMQLRGDHSDDTEEETDTESSVASTTTAVPSKSDFVAFVKAHRELLDDSELVAQYYSAGRILQDPKSFTEFVLPDLRPFPSLVALS
jgi:small GTP-binding protein